MADTWVYEKLNEKGEIDRIYNGKNDPGGKITGKCVINVKAYFDENPDEWKRLGWTKHIKPDQKKVQCNHQSQFIVTSQRQVDPYTIEDVYHVMDKSEEQLAFEEMLSVAEGGSIVFGGLEYA